MKSSCFSLSVLLMFFAVTFFPSDTAACEKAGLSEGQSIYVPAYSHIYSGNRARPFLMTVTLSIRNIDPRHEIKITNVDYYETQGRLVVKYADSAVTLAPLESLRYIVPEKDNSGGSGANFIVEWTSAICVNPPIVEAVMIGTQSQQGISFTSRGQVILATE